MATFEEPPTNDEYESGGNGPNNNGEHHSSPRAANGWDGKLRVDRKAVITNPEALSDPEYSDEDAPPVDRIEADEGWVAHG